jgi:hypothetical protein
MVAAGWSDAQKRAYTIADNKLTLNGGWDDELLGLELGELEVLGSNAILARFQPHRRSVTSVTTVTTDVDLRGTLAVDHLRSMTPPETFDPARWHQLLIDADRFMQRWQHRAELLDWNDQALFGLHPRAPAARFDAMGLVLLVRGGEVVELEEGIARISTIGRSQLTCQKPRHADAIPIWTLMT